MRRLTGYYVKTSIGKVYVLAHTAEEAGARAAEFEARQLSKDYGKTAKRLKKEAIA